MEEGFTIYDEKIYTVSDEIFLYSFRSKQHTKHSSVTKELVAYKKNTLYDAKERNKFISRHSRLSIVIKIAIDNKNHSMYIYIPVDNLGLSSFCTIEAARERTSRGDSIFISLLCVRCVVFCFLFIVS